jgi:hypothetical protein
MDWSAEFDLRQRQNFSLLHNVQNGSGAHPTSYPMGTGRALSLEVKWQGSEADHSPPSNAKVKNGGAIPPHPLVFMACFTFLLCT